MMAVKLSPQGNEFGKHTYPPYTNSTNKKVIGCKKTISYCESQFMTSSFFEFRNSFLSGWIIGNSKSHSGIIISWSTKIEIISKLHLYYKPKLAFKWHCVILIRLRQVTYQHFSNLLYRPSNISIPYFTASKYQKCNKTVPSVAVLTASIK